MDSLHRQAPAARRAIKAKWPTAIRPPPYRVALQREYCRSTARRFRFFDCAIGLGCARYLDRISTLNPAFLEQSFRDRVHLRGVPGSAAAPHPNPFRRGHGAEVEAWT